ncbi:phosphomevalonate kinase, partial [Linderina pennispora]
STLSLATEYVPGAPRKHIAEGCGLKIVLAADNDFYSQRTTLDKLGLQLSSESLRRIPRMGPTGTTLQGVHKTGLGSSAAMVTSLVAALLAHLGAISVESLDPENHSSEEAQRSLRLVHNIAQYAHCLAQGKIGSGFDVSSAVYGSHEYRRFSPSVLEDAMAQTGDVAAVKAAVSPENAAWDNEAIPVQIPPGFTLRLADVDAGSNTPSMVRKILQWKKAFPEKSDKLWQSLHDANAQIRVLWDKLADAHRSDPKGYDSAIAWCAERASNEWETAPALESSTAQQLLVDLVKAIQRVRALQRELGENADVPIEPPKQTRLLDACMQVPGICMAAVPGAGGYDAIYCVALSDDASRRVEELWAQWTEMSVGPLLANQASSGVCALDPAAYPEITSKL